MVSKCRCAREKLIREPAAGAPRYLGGIQTSAHTGGIALVSSTGDFAEFHELLDEFPPGERLSEAGLANHAYD